MFSRLACSLKGRKTYLLAVLGAVVVVLEYFKVLTSETRDTLLGLLGVGVATTLRMSIEDK